MKVLQKTIQLLVNLKHAKAMKKCGLRTNIQEGSNIFFYNKIHPKKDCLVNIGENSLVKASLVFDRENSQINIGSRTFIGGATEIIAASNITIGDDVMIAWGCTIVDHNSHSIFFGERKDDVENWIAGKKNWDNVSVRPVTISNKVWIGLKSIILKGVTIGEGAVVGAGSVVTKDVLPFHVVAGNPARIIRSITEYPGQDTTAREKS